MSLATTIMMLILGWLAVAGAMLWGVLRIARRHHPHAPVTPPEAKGKKAPPRPATAH